VHARHKANNMLERVTATAFLKRMGSGRTKPPLLDCERQNGDRVEVVAKFSGSGCGPHGIVREAIMAMLAADLGLPVPEPVLVDLVEGFIEALPPEQAALAYELRSSLSPTFGCCRLPAGFSVWSSDRELEAPAIEAAAEIFAFDALTLNPDRRASNPNCQWNGTCFAIFDHEMALDSAMVGTTLMPAPWQDGGLSALVRGPGEHILYRGLRGRAPSLTRLEAAWNKIAATRLQEYRDALPAEWVPDMGASLERAIEYLNMLHDHVDEAFESVRSALV
jgi:hypothetical protein